MVNINRIKSEIILNVLIQMYLIFSTLVLVLSIPLIVLLTLLLLTIRIVVQLLAKIKILAPIDLGPMVTTRNTIFAIDNVHESPTANIVVCLTLQGILEIPELQRGVLQKIVQKRNSARKLIYPQLQQCLTKWLGFFFWKQDKQFDISHHVRQLTDEFSPTEHQQLCDIQEVLIHQPFAKNKSPWEFLVMHCFENRSENNEINSSDIGKNQTVIFFRVHHSLCDGFSILKILMSDLCDQDLVLPSPSTKAQRPSSFNLSSIPRFIWAVLKIPYDQVKQRHYSKDTNVWHNHGLGPNLSRKYHAVLSEPISVSLVKNIKEKFNKCKNKDINVTFSSVLFEGITAGIRKYFVDTNMKKLPKYIHTVCPVAIPGFSVPEELGNHWTFCFVKLPTGVDGVGERLEQIGESIKMVSNSKVTQTNFGLISIVGGLSTSMIRQLSKNSFSTIITSIFPGPKDPCVLCGHFVTNMTFAGGLLHGDQGICATIISYNGKFQIFLMVDHALISSKKTVQQLVDNISNSISELHTE